MQAFPKQSGTEWLGNAFFDDTVSAFGGTHFGGEVGAQLGAKK